MYNLDLKNKKKLLCRLDVAFLKLVLVHTFPIMPLRSGCFITVKSKAAGFERSINSV